MKRTLTLLVFVATLRGQVALTEKEIEERDKKIKGITVGEPKVYDDSLLQQMLSGAQARLMSLQAIDQASIVKNFGAVTGATLNASSFGLSVQGGSTPQVVTTSKGATGSTVGTDVSAVSTDGKPSSSNTMQTTNGAASRDTAVTSPSVTVPGSNAMAPAVTLPTAFSVSASDILNEQMQLTYEIANLRLLMEGAQSDRVLLDPNTNLAVVKPRATIGFPISITARKDYKNAMAVVEIEVEVPKGALLKSGELPAITALLPREKSYNVASIKERNTSLGGGVATQLVGVSASWNHSRKSYYIVKDQDTIALTYQPTTAGRIGFRWEFRPVLGEEFVRSGLKQTFVQIAFPTLASASPMGTVHVRSYWRKFDRGKGLAKEVVRGSVTADAETSISNIPLKQQPKSFSVSDIEDLGGGQLLVTLRDQSFVSGTYVRVGNAILQDGSGLILRYRGLQFLSTPSDLANKKVTVGGRDGTEVSLQFSDGSLTSSVQGAVLAAPSCAVETVDEGNSRLVVTMPTAIDPFHTPDPTGAKPYLPLLLVLGGKAFGYSDAPVVQAEKTLSVVLPTAFLVANPDVQVHPLFMKEKYWRGARCNVRQALSPASVTERLVLLEQGKDYVRLLLLGNRLGNAKVVEPAGVAFESFGSAAANDTARLLRLSAAQVKAFKQVAIEKASNERPITLALPAIEFKETAKADPKAKDRVNVGTDQITLVGDGFKDLLGVSFNDAPLKFAVAADGKSVVVSGLKASGATGEAKTRGLKLYFKPGPVSVDLEVVNAKVETQAK